MLHRNAIVTYAASLQFLSSDFWTQILTGLTTQLPLRDLHWSSKSRLSTRTIKELDIDLVSLETWREEGTSQIPLTVLERPLLNVYIVTCDDNETYKNTVKKQIKDWHTSVCQRKNQDWLILHVMRSDTRVASGLLKMRGTVLDKIRADFNVDKKDRCVQLVWSNGTDKGTVWAEVMDKIKESLMLSFDAAIASREEEVKRSESQRQMPGWNFCTFFILKETMSNSFEGMNLLEDAVLQYDELEAAFFQVTREKNVSWFGSLITPEPNDDSLPLLSVTKKPYRDLILANTISIFDFRIYLLARQCNLMGKMGKVAEAGRKIIMFLYSFSRKLRGESWVYSAALTSVEKFAEWSRDSGVDTSSTAAVQAVKGELLELARIQLDQIGLQLSYLPRSSVFLPVGDSADVPVNGHSDPSSRTKEISNKDLTAAIDDRNIFYDQYVRLTNRAIDMYVKAGRRKFALKLHGSLAALDLHRQRYGNALQTYSSLPAHYSPHRWTSLESFMLLQGIETHSKMDKEKNSEWLHMALNFLKVYVTELHPDFLVSLAEDYVEQLVQTVTKVANVLSSDLSNHGHPMLSVRVQHLSAKCISEQDGYSLDLTILNKLPCQLPVDEVSLTLLGQESTHARFSTGSSILSSGSNSLTLTCPVPTYGLYVPEVAIVRIGRLLLQWNFVASPKKRAITPQQRSVKLPKDPNAVDVTILQPQSVRVGGSSSVLLSINTGRNTLTSLKCKVHGKEIKFHHNEASLDKSCNQTNIELTDELVLLKDIVEHRTVLIDIPYIDPRRLDKLSLMLDIEYITGLEPSLIRGMKLSRAVSVATPVVVNVEDIFRANRLTMYFTVSTISHQHVRMSRAELSTPSNTGDSDNTKKLTMTRDVLQTIKPGHPGHCVFQVNNDILSENALELRIQYRMLREEVQDVIWKCIQGLSNEASIKNNGEAIQAHLVKALESSSQWVNLYEATGQLHVPDLALDADAPTAEVETVKKELLRGTMAHLHGGDWREIVLIVDVPSKDILAATRIYTVANPFTTDPLPVLPSIYSGQPMSAVVFVEISLQWSRKKDHPTSYKMQYEVEEIVSDWLISGRRRGEFSAKDGTIVKVPITLIAVRHGQIALPRVQVQLDAEGISPVPNEIPSLESYQTHAAERIMILPRSGRTTYVVDMDDEE